MEYMKILPWILIVSISFSSSYQTEIACSQDGCRILSEVELQEHKQYALDKLNERIKQNMNISDKDDRKALLDYQSTYPSELVDDLEKMLTDKFKTLELNLLNFVTEEMRKNTEIISKNFKKTVVELRPPSPKLIPITTSKSTRKKALPSDCWDIFEAGHKSNGVQTIYPQGYETKVYCDMKTVGGGWTVFLNRQWQPVQENFKRSWQVYKDGFGDPDMEYWMGNEALHLMTTSKDYIMRLDAVADHRNKDLKPRVIWGEFNFRVSSEADKYRLTIDRNDTTGTMDRVRAGDVFDYNNNQFFTTYDRDNDNDVAKNCANYSWTDVRNGGGFWFNNCSFIYPMAIYGTIHINHWSTTTKTWGYASHLQMKLRPIKATSPKVTQTITQKESTMSVKTTTPISTSLAMNTLPSDCWDIFEAGHISSGVQTIYPQGYKTTVYCDMSTDGGGWTMLLNRQWQQLQENFTRNWQEYKVGFGDRDKEHWMGNEALHLMTTSKDYIMRIDAFSSDKVPRNIWGKFNIKVASEDELYRLTIKRNDTMGNMDRSYGGGTFVFNNGQFFTTYDSDNDRDANKNCANMSIYILGRKGGGFWHKTCFHITPTGPYGGIFLKYWSTTSEEKRFAFACDLKMTLRPGGK